MLQSSRRAPLTDLRVAMTLDPGLIDTINTNLANLDVPDLAALRAAALPILVAWAKAVKLPDASGTLQVVDPAAGHTDVPILLSTDGNGNVTVDDFGYQVTDDSGTYWRLASGGLVRDADGNAIDRPTFAQVMAQAPASGSSDSWQNFSAAERPRRGRRTGRSRRRRAPVWGRASRARGASEVRKRGDVMLKQCPMQHTASKGWNAVIQSGLYKVWSYNCHQWL